MRNCFVSSPARSGGFTLVELMVVVLIVTILATIALPTYQAQVRKSRRTEAKTALLDLAGREERLMSTTGSYTTTLGSGGLGFSGTSVAANNTASNYYAITISNVNAGQPATLTTSATPPTFTITATTYGVQTKDTACNKLAIDQSGSQTATDSSGNAATSCW